MGRVGLENFPNTGLMDYSVLLKNEEQLRFGPIGQALAIYRSVPTLDTVNEAKKCWGILTEKISEADAGRLIASLAKYNLLGIPVPQEAMRNLPPVINVDAVDEFEGGIRLVDENEAVHDLKGQDVHVIGAAAFRSVTQKKIEEKQGPTTGQRAASIGIMLATGLPISIGPKKKTIQKTISDTELLFMMEIVAGNPARRFRIEGTHVNYAFLKERMVAGAMGNFRLLLSDAVLRAPQARRSRGTRILLANEPVTGMGYEGIPDLERECRWLLSIPAQTA